MSPNYESKLNEAAWHLVKEFEKVGAKDILIFNHAKAILDGVFCKFVFIENDKEVSAATSVDEEPCGWMLITEAGERIYEHHPPKEPHQLKYWIPVFTKEHQK